MYFTHSFIKTINIIFHIHYSYTNIFQTSNLLITVLLDEIIQLLIFFFLPENHFIK